MDTTRPYLTGYVLADEEPHIERVEPHVGPALWIAVDTEEGRAVARVMAWGWSRPHDGTFWFGPLAMVNGEWWACDTDHPGVFWTREEAEAVVAQG